ncbi:MAG TPA: ATP-binding protein [Polyangia bacterium]|nr:ATP-binding protein [Polyangia bacterium]
MQRASTVILLRFQSDLRYRNLVLRATQAAAKLVGQGDHPVFDDEVVAACSEAFNNIAVHAYPETPGEVEIQIEVHEDAVTIRMLDHGRSYELDDQPDPDLESLPESGLGIFIIKSFMDQVIYRPGAPNLLEMTKRIVSRPEQAATV